VSFWTIAATVGVIATAYSGDLAADPRFALFPRIGIGFVAFGPGFVRACWRFLKNGIPYLEGVILGALNDDDRALL